MARIEDFITLVQFTSGRAQYAVSQMAALSPEPNPTIQAAQAAAVQLAALEARWATRKAQPTARGDAALIDVRLDRVIAVLHQHLEGRQALFGQDAQGKLASQIRLRYLPGGIAAITQLPFEDELAAAERIIAGLQGPDAPAVAQLQLEPILAELVRWTAAMRVELGRIAPETIRFDTVRAARAELQRALTLVVAQAITTHSAPEQADAFAAFLAPLVLQMDRIRSLRTRRRPVTDVDPGTGEEDPSAPSNPLDADA